VMVALLRHVNNRTGRCYPGIARIARRAALGVTSTRKALP
jgi:hypothetical protein